MGLAKKSNAGSTLGALLLGAVVVVVALRAVFSARQPVLLRLWAVVPPFVLLATYSVLHLYAMRYIVFTLPAFALLLANALERPGASERFRKWATPVTVLVLVVFGFNMQLKSRSSLARASGDYHAMAEDLKSLAKPGDAVTNADPTNLLEGIPRDRAKLLQNEFVVSEVHPHWRANLALLTRKSKPAEQAGARASGN